MNIFSKKEFSEFPPMGKNVNSDVLMVGYLTLSRVMFRAVLLPENGRINSTFN